MDESDEPNVADLQFPDLDVDATYHERLFDERDWSDIAGEAEFDLIQNGIVEQSEDRARAYLATYGDAAWERAAWAMTESQDLLTWGSPEASLVFAAVAAELVIRFLVVRPLVAGIVFSDVLAERIATGAASGRSRADRELLPNLSQHWNLGLETLAMADGTLLLKYLMGTLWSQRDGLVHRGELVAEEDARRALEAVQLILDTVVEPLAKRLRLSWPYGPWSHPGASERSPFERARP